MIRLGVNIDHVATLRNARGGNYPDLLKFAKLISKNSKTQTVIVRNQKELSKDNIASWTEVECLGACVNAPMMQINDNYYEDLDKEKTLKILESLLKGETPKPGSYRGRINNEPENNRKTLLDLKNA